MLLFRKPGLDIASDLVLRHGIHIWVPGRIGHASLWHVLVVLLIVLLVEVLGRRIAKVVCVHRLVRRKCAAVIHLAGRVSELHLVCPTLVRADGSEYGRADVARENGGLIQTARAVE